MKKRSEADLPILTDVVELHASSGATGMHPVVAEPPGAEHVLLAPEDLAALQSELVTRAIDLTEELLHGAVRELEGMMFERVLDRLRAALPEIVSLALREHLKPGQD